MPDATGGFYRVAVTAVGGSDTAAGIAAVRGWRRAGGLAAPNSATVIDNRGGEAMVTDGPFLESKEYLIGFWIMEAPDLDVALKLSAEASKACNRKIEVRPFL